MIRMPPSSVTRKNGIPSLRIMRQVITITAITATLTETVLIVRVLPHGRCTIRSTRRAAAHGLFISLPLLRRPITKKDGYLLRRIPRTAYSDPVMLSVWTGMCGFPSGSVLMEAFSLFIAPRRAYKSAARPDAQLNLRLTI